MKSTVTNQELLQMHNDVVRKKQTVDRFFQAAKIQQWENDNRITIQRVAREQQDIFEKYFVHVNGKLTFDEKKQPVLQEGMLMVMYEKEIADFLKETVRVEG